MDSIKKQIKNILVATDFSETSNFAILRAIEIAKPIKANITLIHIIQKNTVEELIEKIIPKEVLQSPKEYASNFILEKIHSLSHHNININYIILSQGKPAVKILRFIKKYKFDLLIMGAHGSYSIRDTFVGTTAEYIAKRIQCPVLIVKNLPGKPYRKILVPIDFSSASNNALKYSIKLFNNHNIRLIHVGDYQYENLLKREEDEENVPKNKIHKVQNAILFYLDHIMKKFTQKFRKNIDINNYKITLGYPGPNIIKEASKFNCNLIIMGTRGHGRMHYLLTGSVANWVLTETDKDILLVPPKIHK